MTTDNESLQAYFDRETTDLVSQCTMCGKCVEVCPVTQGLGCPSAMGEGDGRRVVKPLRYAGINQSVQDSYTLFFVRYLGAEAGQAYYDETKAIPRVNIRITPQTTTTWGGGGWHPRYNT